MCKKTLLLSLFLFHAAHGMETLQSTRKDVMKKIFGYAIWVEVEDFERWGEFGESLPDESNDPWHTIKRNYSLQLVSKDFKSVFWDCFTVSGKIGVIRRLLYHKNKESTDLVDIAVSMQASLYPILRHAIYGKSNLECVRAILAIADTNVINKIDTINKIYKRTYLSVTPLHMAIDAGHIDIVKLLLAHPMTDVNATFPLATAVSEENVEMVKLLLAHPKIQVNAVNKNGETALFAVANAPIYKSRFPKNKLNCTIALLINAGIDSTIKNNDGYTALDIAYQQILVVMQKALAIKNKV